MTRALNSLKCTEPPKACVSESLYGPLCFPLTIAVAQASPVNTRLTPASFHRTRQDVNWDNSNINASTSTDKQRFHEYRIILAFTGHARTSESILKNQNVST